MQALRALRHLELHVVAVGERTEAISLDGREVNENVLPGILHDESESLHFTEPLHLATTHFVLPFPGVARHCFRPIADGPGRPLWPALRATACGSKQKNRQIEPGGIERLLVLHRLPNRTIRRRN